MMYMKYPRGDNGWVPSEIKDIAVENIVIIAKNRTNHRGFVFHVCEARITDEDATYITLKIDQSKFPGSIKISKKSFRKDK